MKKTIIAITLATTAFASFSAIANKRIESRYFYANDRIAQIYRKECQIVMKPYSDIFKSEASSRKFGLYDLHNDYSKYETAIRAGYYGADGQKTKQKLKDLAYERIDWLQGVKTEQQFSNRVDQGIEKLNKSNKFTVSDNRRKFLDEFNEEHNNSKAYILNNFKNDALNIATIQTNRAKINQGGGFGKTVLTNYGRYVGEVALNKYDFMRSECPKFLNYSRSLNNSIKPYPKVYENYL